jgi:ABC-type lipoprotein export system ATPase subunit
MVTHDQALARYASRIVTMRDGEVAADTAQQARATERTEAVS